MRNIISETAWLNRGGNEWNRAWAKVHAHPLNEDVKELDDWWMYMGTEKHDDLWEHFFKTGAHKLRLRVPAWDGWKPSDEDWPITVMDDGRCA